MLFVFNYTPVPRHGYRVGVPWSGFWQERLNSDAEIYGGSGMGNMGGREAVGDAWQGQPAHLMLELPPLSCMAFVPSMVPDPVDTEI